MDMARLDDLVDYLQDHQKYVRKLEKDAFEAQQEVRYLCGQLDSVRSSLDDILEGIMDWERGLVTTEELLMMAKRFKEEQ